MQSWNKQFQLLFVLSHTNLTVFIGLIKLYLSLISFSLILFVRISFGNVNIPLLNVFPQKNILWIPEPLTLIVILEENEEIFICSNLNESLLKIRNIIIIE